MSTHFQIELHGRVLVIQFLPPQLFEHLVLNELDDELREAIREYEPRYAVFDFSRVSFCSSSIINALLRVRKRLARQGGQVAIAELNGGVLEAFKVLSLDRNVFVPFDTVQAAVDHFLEEDAWDDETKD